MRAMAPKADISQSSVGRRSPICGVQGRRGEHPAHAVPVLVRSEHSVVLKLVHILQRVLSCSTEHSMVGIPLIFGGSSGCRRCSGTIISLRR